MKTRIEEQASLFITKELNGSPLKDPYTKQGFISGAEWMRRELTQWHEPNKEDFPQELNWKPLQLLLTQPFSQNPTIRGGFFGAGDFVIHGDYWPDRQILGWRYIPE